MHDELEEEVEEAGPSAAVTRGGLGEVMLPFTGVRHRLGFTHHITLT